MVGRMSPRVLHVLSQRPMRTGSGVTLDAMVARAASAGWEQRVVCAAPASEPVTGVGGLPPDSIDVLSFDTAALPHSIPGMSDVMPYASRRFSSLSEQEVETYLAAWRDHLTGVVSTFKPDVIHVHHLWLVASLIKDIAPDTRVVNHCHGTGLRQMSLCPTLAPRVVAGCGRNDVYLALHEQQARAIVEALGVAPERVQVIGAGYRAEVFCAAPGTPRAPQAIVFAGKLAGAKGLPPLLDAVARIAERRPVTLHVAGGGRSSESDALRARMASMSNCVQLEGMLSQTELAELFRRSAVFVLPSMFEGLPLVLVEALACGCRAVATDLPGVREVARGLEDVIAQVAAPRRANVDEPLPEDLPAFVEALVEALTHALDAPPVDVANLANRLRPATWDAVFERIERLWVAARA